MADVLVEELPLAYQQDPASLIARFLSEEQKAKAAYLLSFGRQKSCEAVDQALRLVTSEQKLSPDWWRVFQDMGEKTKRAPRLEVAREKKPYFSAAEDLLDGLLLEITEQLDPATAQQMTTAQRYGIFKILLGPVGLGRQTSAFLKARRKIYASFDLPPEVEAHYQEALHTIAEGYWNKKDHFWLNFTKKTWRFQTSRMKEEYLYPFHTFFSGLLGLPQLPDFDVVSTRRKKYIFLDGDDASSLPTSDGTFFSWSVYNRRGSGFGQRRWVNHIKLYDGSTAMGRDTVTHYSLRMGLCSLFHEECHSLAFQTEARLFGDDQLYSSYRDSFQDGEAPAPLSPQDPLYNAARISALYLEMDKRRSYVVPGKEEDSGDKRRQIYSGQPVERWANRYDTLAAGVINGTLVLREVEAQDRCLAQELSAFFRKAGRFLTFRDRITEGKDLKPLKARAAISNNRCRILPKKIAAAPLSDLGLEKIDYAAFADKRALLHYYTSALAVLRRQKGMTDEKMIPFFVDALDFLVQLPDEADEAIRRMPQKKGRAFRRYNQFYRESYQILHELGDFAYMAGHPIRKSCPLPTRKPLMKRIVPYPVRLFFRLHHKALS